MIFVYYDDKLVYNDLNGWVNKGYQTISMSSDTVIESDLNAVIQANSTEPSEPPALLLDLLDGGEIYVDADIGQTETHQYGFENIEPTIVEQNNVEDSDYVFESWGEGNPETGITTNINGLVTVVAPRGYNGSISKQINVAFKQDDKSVTDTFIARTYGVCFQKGTLIMMSDNTYKYVEALDVGDEVMTYDIEKNQLLPARVIMFRTQNGVGDVVNLTFKSGRRLGITATHAIYTKDGWKIYRPSNTTNIQEAYSIGDGVLTSDGEYDEIVDIQEDESLQVVYHLSIDNGNTLIVNGGLIVEPEQKPTPKVLTKSRMRSMGGGYPAIPIEEIHPSPHYGWEN